MNSKDVIKVNHVSFSYDGIPVLEDVHFTIPERSFISIVGPNAGGKTTLLKLMLGLLRPSQGTIEVLGMDPVKARTRIGYMPQQVQLDLQFPVTVLDVVLMGRMGHGWSIGPFSRTDRAIALDALRKLEMQDMAGRPFMALSGGQRQRVLIARALASEPEMLFLDEPTANVDMVVETELFELLHQMSKTITVVVVSHDLGFVSHYVQSVVCVNRCVRLHPTAAVTGEVIRDLYLSDVCMVRHHHGEG
jgi:zinc transport system ATP-binding protein